MGLEPAIRVLKGQIAQDRVAHAYLFVGPQGIGKGTLAREFAKALECEKPKGGDACDECDACLKVGRGTFPDVMVPVPLKESGDFGIDDMRDLERRISLTPHKGPWKVAVIEGAERLTEHGMHSFLKLLEEPPARSVIILLSAALYRMYPTVISRCHAVRCSPQGVEQVAAALRERAGLAPEAARRVAISSEGRMGLALRLHEGGLLSARNAALDQLLCALRRGEIEVPSGKVSREEVRESMEWYASWWRDLLVLSLGGDPDWVIHQDRLEELKKVIASPAEGRAKQTQGELIDSLLDRVEHSYFVHDAVQRNANIRNALAVLLSR